MMKSILKYTFIALFFLFASESFAQQQTGLQIVHSRIPQFIKKMGLTPIRQMDKTKQLKLVIGLPLRNQITLNNLMHELYNPTSPKFHHFLSHPEFISKFGPAAADYQAVIAFAKANGFNVTRTYSDNMILDISGSVSTIEKAFHIHMNMYKHLGESRDFFAPDAEPSINLSIPISSISGLNNYQIPRPAGYHIQKHSNIKSAALDGSGPYESYKGNDFRAAYARGSLWMETAKR